MEAQAPLDISPNQKIAYHRLHGEGDGAMAPGLVFLGGFRSDMTGLKARFVEDWARARGRSFVRFDYRGHGQTSGDFEALGISDWLADAAAVLANLTNGPQILVGSSMGGWISLLLARAQPERVAGLVGLAAAPDFTEDGMWARFSEDERAQIMETGRIEVPSEYSEEPYPISRHLIEDGRRSLVLRSPLILPFPVRLIHGTADPDVPVDVAERLFAHLESPDARLTLVKGAGHRLSEPSELALIGETLDEISRAIEPGGAC